MGESIYLYDGSFEGFLCCIFESYIRREVPSGILRDEDSEPILFATHAVTTDASHAERVLRRVLRLSPYAAELLKRGFLTCLPEREMHLYRLVAKLLRDGSGFLNDGSDAVLRPVLKAVRHLNGEAQLLRGFVRFSELGGVLGSEIEPKNRVLPLLRGHFCSRYRNERFFIYDRTHREVLCHFGGTTAILPLEHFQMAPPDETEAEFRLLWKRFYDTIAIRERYNPRCRMTQMPKRYWGTMTEFQGSSYFTAENSPADDPAPAAPAAIPAPEKPAAPEPSAPVSIP